LAILFASSVNTQTPESPMGGSVQAGPERGV
jgi:hypothetical protein